MSPILVESKKFDGFCMISHGDRRMDVKKLSNSLSNDRGKQLHRPLLNVNKCYFQSIARSFSFTLSHCVFSQNAGYRLLLYIYISVS